MILLECRQMFSQGILYFKEAYNYLDIMAYVFVIETGLSVFLEGEEAYKEESRKLVLIMSILMLGLRALS